MKLHKRNKCWLLFLFFLAFPLFADYTITVQNGPQPLFQHPVSVELTAEQTAFVQAGIYLEEVSEDGNNTSDLLDYTLDTTGETPQLRWTLRGETNPAQQRFFRLIDFNAYPPPRRGSDLECTITDGFITIHNSYFQLRHPLQGKGGFPQDIQYRESGYTDHELFFFDRLFHPDHGQFWVRLDSQATAQVVLNTPECVIVEIHAQFVGDGGLPAPGQPTATYRYIYSAYSPAVHVERILTREDAALAWPEAHFLQACRYDRFYTAIHTCEPGQSRATNPANAEPNYIGFSQWGIYATPLGAYGIGGTSGNVYDRGTEGFPYNIAAQNLGWPTGEATKRQSALLYFGPARDGAWYERWLDTAAQPQITIAEDAEDIANSSQAASAIASTYVVETDGLRVHFGSAEEGFPCIGVENTLSDTPVRFVFPRKGQPSLWKIAFQKPYEVRQQEITQPDYIETAWLSSAPTQGSVPVVNTTNEGLVFEWQGLDLPGEPGVVDVRCSVLTHSCAQDSSFWRIEVTNRSTQWGLTETQFPILTQVIQPGRGDALLPGSNWGHHLYRNSQQQFEWTYPSHKCQLQFMAFNQGDAGLYFAAHDPGARPKRLAVTSAQDAKFAVYAENYAQPGASRCAEFDFCLAAYQGDWWQAAKRYREWAIGEAPWTAKGPIATRQDFPRSLVDASFWMCLTTLTSPDQLGTLMESLHARINHRPGFALHWYCWHQIPFDNSYPEYFPVRDGFQANVRRLTSQGILVMPYINGRLWDVEIPSFNDEARNACALTERGTPAIEEYGSGRKLTPMCPYTRLWQNKLDDITTRLMDEYGVSGIYIDQISCAAAELCFNPTHGHPLGGGTHWVDGYRTLLNRIKAKAAPKGIFLTSECGAEPYMDNIDGHLVWTERSQNEVPTLPAVYSGYTIFFSNTCDERDDLASFQAVQARDFLWGCQPGWNQVWIADEAHREHFAYEAYLGHLQQAAKEFFREGELLVEAPPAHYPGTVTVTWNYEHTHQATLQAVQGYWWKAPDGRLLLAIANLSSDVRRFEVDEAELNRLSGHQKRTDWLAERLTDQGTAPLAQIDSFADFSHTYTLEPNEVVLTVFTPADGKTFKNAQKHAETLALDEQIAPELRNAATEYLFRTKYHLWQFTPDFFLMGALNSTVDFTYTLYSQTLEGKDKPFQDFTIVLPDGHEVPALKGYQDIPIAFGTSPEPELAYCELRHGDLAWRLPVQRTPKRPLEVTLGEPPEIRAGKSFLLPVTIMNYQNSPATGIVRINAPDDWQIEPSRVIPFENLLPFADQNTRLRVCVPSETPAAPVLLSAEILTGREEQTFTVQPARPQLAAIRVPAPLDVHDAATWPDGAWTTLGEATPQGIKIADYRGDADCSARLRAAWDDECLYLQVEVIDDTHLQTHSNQFIWQEDCLQFALHPAPANLTPGYDGLEREFGIALPNHTTGIVFVWMGGGDGQGLLADAQIHATREGTTTRYLVTIPWSALVLKSPRPGETLGFSFTVNDNDSDHLRGWLEWSSGVCGGKDSTLFGELQLLE